VPDERVVAKPIASQFAGAKDQSDRAGRLCGLELGLAFRASQGFASRYR
jgi:hypothetical protein